MDVRNLNGPKQNGKTKLSNSTFPNNVRTFSMETYFTWFSALIFTTELFVDFSVAFYYLNTNQVLWGLCTIAIIFLPLILCQCYSMWLLKGENNQVKASAIFLHLLLLGIMYRYYNILRKIDKNKSNNQGSNTIAKTIYNVNSVQTLNATIQYCPQFLLQSFLIIYQENKSVLTGMSAGFAAFSLFWYLFIRFYYWIKRYNEEVTYDCEQAGPVQIIDNLTPSFNENPHNRNSESSSSIAQNFSQAATNLTDLKNFEKSIFTTDERNLSSKRHISNKNIEKIKIFNFNKRKPIYEQTNLDISDKHDNSLIFFEFEDSLASSKFDLSSAGVKDHGNFTDGCNLKKKDFGKVSREDEKFVSIPGNRNSLLKRKGICSSQEMLYLVDILNDSISPDEVDLLAKSLVDMGGDCSLQTESDHDNLDNSKLLEHFPDVIDDKLLENIDAVIYENQIIFQERIRKNKLTIQNLKIQDQMLSKCIEDMKVLPCCEILSIRDYENMCFQNISRQNRGMKHWRNYLHDIDTNNHDNSTIQHSSYYVNTTNTDTLTNSLSDLYINETGKASSLHVGDRQKSSDNVGGERNYAKKNVRWRSKLKTENESSCCETVSDDLYIVMDSGAYAIPEKNILVETINSINIDSPVKRSTNSGKNQLSIE